MSLSRFAPLLALLALSTPVFAGDDTAKEKPAASATPEDCYAAFKAALLAKDGKAFWAILSQKTKKWFAVTAEEARTNTPDDLAKEIGVTTEELARLDPKDIAMRRVMATVDDAAKKRLESETIKDLTIRDKMATAFRVSGEDDRPIIFIKGGDGWYVGMGAGECDGGEEEEKK